MPDEKWAHTDDHAPAAPAADPNGWVNTADHAVDVLDNPGNRFAYKTAEGVPVYLAPGQSGSFTEEAIKNPIRQAAAGVYGASAEANHLTANIFSLLDQAAGHVANLTGTQKGGLFKNIEEWARNAQQSQEHTAALYAGDRKDFASQLYRGMTQGILQIPEYGVAAAAGGPVAGFAGLGAIRESDQGWGAALKAAAEGALMGGALEVMGPASRPIRLTGAAAMTYVQARMKGADHTTALAQATTMGALNAQRPGGATLREMLPERPIRVIPPLFENPNPTEQAAYDYMREAGVAPNAGAATGAPFIKFGQKAADTSPVGAIVGGNAQRQTTAAIRGRATDLVARATPQVSPDTHYAEFAEMEANPANARSVPTGAKDAEGNPETVDMQMPVPVGVLKPALKPIFDQMQWMPAADRNASAGYTAIKKILEGPDYIEASQAETGLGGIKKMAREGDGRNAGIAKFIVPKLQELIDGSVNRVGGEDAMRALQQGRISAAQQAGADWLTDIFKTAEDEGGFHREQGIWNKWQGLKDPVKKSMFSEEQIRELDKFFLGVKKLSENPNPSGSGVQASVVGQLLLAFTHPTEGVPVIAAGGALSKLFHSDFGVKLLTEGLTVHPGTPRGDEIAANIRGIAGGRPVVERLQDMGEAALERMRQRGTFSGTKLNAGVPIDDMKDMAIWGAAKLAQGTVSFSKWSKEMLADAAGAGLVDLNRKVPLRKLYEDSQKIFGRHVDTTQDQLPSTKQLLKLTKQGMDGADWYRKTKEELVQTFGPKDADVIIDFLAATTNNATVAANVALALKAYRQYRLGQPFEGFLGDVKDQLNAVLKGQEFGGLKVRSFRANLHGDPEAVTIDRWMHRAFGFRKPGITDQQYKFIDYIVTQVAKRQGMEPRQVQAAIWKAIKESEQKNAGNTSLPFEKLLPKKLAEDPELKQLAERARGGQAAPPRP